MSRAQRFRPSVVPATATGIALSVTLAAALAVPGASCNFDEAGLRRTQDATVTPVCGDGVLDDGEECDGPALGGQTCLTLGYVGGVLGCTSSCTLDESQCELPEGCGDGVVGGSEECDGADLGGQTCQSLTGHTAGTPMCRVNCTLDTSDCHTCGDDTVEGGEQCDGLDLAGASCAGLGHQWGDLACAPDCSFDESGCFDYPQNWFDVDCPFRKGLTIDPAHVDTGLQQFPVLVELVDADLRDYADPSGGDLHFAAADGSAQLDHELEQWDPATGTLVAWVKVPSVSAAQPTTFYLYYGDVGCGGATDPTAVWDANYRGVWHLAQPGTGDRFDSTANMRHASTAGYDGDEATAGHPGGADVLDGTDDHLVLPESATTGLADFTMCFWLRTTENRSHTTGWHNPTLLGNISGGYYSADFGVYTSSGLIGLRSGLCTGLDQGQVSTVAVNDDAWHYVCAVAQSTLITLYVDDVYAAQVCGGARTMLPPAFWVGGHSGTTAGEEGDFHAGTIDELRISDGVRSAAWRSASYANQASPSTFYTVGAQESLSP